MGRKKKDVVEEIVEEAVEAVEAVEGATKKSKREIIADCIEAGGATMESLMAAAGCKYASVMSNFSMLRLMGKNPVKDVPVESTNEDGETVTELTYRLVSNEEWAAIKAEKAANTKTKKAPARTPEQMLEILTKRVNKATIAMATANDRATASPDSPILYLRFQKAEIELKIANLELVDFQEKNPGVELSTVEASGEVVE